MIVLDTHAWIWMTDSPAHLGKGARRAIRDAKVIGVSAISCWEFAMLVEKGRIEESDPLGWIEDALSQPKIELLPLTPAVAVRASKIGPQSDPADRIIMATAILEDAVLVTKDEVMRAHSSARTVW